eukprot:TRINITY_DN633_c0_g2_i1.p1 TRINITY_DN633_c0_g2~~TRINITY_DN633_c0_g2_i1.p1  ORF type:complete len:711 (-),score=225.75 TRINITY_DN633_c0_g2_i1:649-2781(-)
MTLSEASTLHSLAVWKEDCSYIKDFISKQPLPQILRIVKGHYQGLGASSSLSSNPQSVILLLNLGSQKRIHAQCVKFKDLSRKVSTLGPKLAIPASYEGYFEILSEDGRCVRSMESVEELGRRFPDSVLVRENIRAFLSKSDEETERSKEKTRIVSVGETLLLIGEVNNNNNNTSSNSSNPPNNGGSHSLISSSSGSSGSSHSSQRFLRCFDERGENVYLPYEAKGKFSVIAKEDGISGVHSVSNILNKRLPLMARLASGPSPPVGLRHSQPFVPEMRLFSSASEDLLMAFTLNGKEAPTIVPLPASVLLKVQAASNNEILKQTSEFSRLLSKAKDLGGQLMNQLMVHDISLGRDLRLHGLDKQHKASIRQISSPPLSSQNTTTNNNNSASQNNVNSIGSPTSKNTEDYDEIEQIYDYVRGFAPLPKGAKPWVFEDVVPEPPPLETLPTRLNKSAVNQHNHQHHPHHHHHTSMDYIGSNYAWMGSNQYLNSEVKQRIPDMKGKYEVKKRPSTKELKPNENKNPDPSLRTRYIKSGNPHRQLGQKHKFFRSNKKEAQGGPMGGSSGVPGHPTRPSPLFNLRYKSLTNLAGNGGVLAYSPDYDTLNSSNSGGKTSGDSGGSRNLPEKRSRQLIRPKSLTNLVWGPPSAQSGPHAVKISSSDNKPSKQQHPPSSGGLYAHRRLSKELSSSSAIHGRKLGSSGKMGKRIGTLYL